MPLFIWLDADCQAKLISSKLMQRRAKAVEKETSGLQVKVQPCLGRMTSCFGSNAISRTTDIWFGAA
jgi:alanine dehydrogenase